MNSSMPAIGIDARAASHPQPGGFKTYVTNLIRGLVAVDKDHAFYVYLDRPSLNRTVTTSERLRIEVISARGIPYAGPAWREQILLPVRGLTAPVDAFHFPAGSASLWHPAPKIITIHDAIEQMPARVTGRLVTRGGGRRLLMDLYNRYSIRLAARNAVRVITVSECSRRDIAKYLRVSLQKIRVVPAAPGPQYRRLSKMESRGFDLTGSNRFVMAIGSADPRKNLATLIRAYAALPADLIARYHLVLVWTHRLLQYQILGLADELGVAERIISVYTPTDHELCELYNAATVFVFPSLYEGFGLPPLEAMSCGTPVIASNTSSLPEVLEDAALLVDPRSIADLTGALASLLSDDNARHELSIRGLAHARRFSWERTAAQTLSIYDEVVSTATA